jgi:hypothetical protein
VSTDTTGVAEGDAENMTGHDLGPTAPPPALAPVDGRQLAERSPLPAALAPSEADRFRVDLASAAEAIDKIVDSEVFPTSFWVLPHFVKGDYEMPGKDRRRKHENESMAEYVYRRNRAIGGGAYAVVWGQDLGMRAPLALNSLHVISGKIGLSARAIRGLVIAPHRGHQWRWGKIDHTIAEARVRRAEERDDPEAWQEFEFTFERAVRAGYVPQQGPNAGTYSRDDVEWIRGRPTVNGQTVKLDQGNAKYLTNPEDMLVARLSSTIGSLVFPDVLAGMDVMDVLQDDAQRAAVTVTADATHAPARMAELTGRPAAAPAWGTATPPAEAATESGGGDASPQAAQPDTVATPSGPQPMNDETATAIGAWFEANGLVGHGRAKVERRNWIAREVLGMPDLGGIGDLDDTQGRELVTRLAALDEDALGRFGLGPKAGQ